MSRILDKRTYSNGQLIGKYVKIISNASYKHYKQIGQIVGFTKKGNYIRVYIGDTGSCVNFCRDSLELLNP